MDRALRGSFVALAGLVLACGAGEGGPPAGAGAAGLAGAPLAGGGGAGAGGSVGQGQGGQLGGESAAGGGNGSGAAAPGGLSSVGTDGGGDTGTAGPITCRRSGDGRSSITLVNGCDDVVSFRGSGIEGGELAPGEHACRHVGSDVEMIPAIRYWGFIGEDPGGERHTLAELTLNTDFNDFDWYNISHVDAHNLPMRIEAVDMPQCRRLTCAESLLADCPEVGLFTDGAGQVVSCVSPSRDDPQSEVAQYFEARCDDAYSWSGDDAESMAACAGEDYDVVFCPPSD